MKKRAIGRLITAGAILGFTALLIYGAVIFLYVFLKQKVLDSVSEALKRPVKYETYILNPLGYMRITGLDASPALRIEEIEVWFDPITLIKDRRIRAIEACGVFLDVDSLVSGIAAGSRPSPEGQKPVSYPVFVIEHGDIRDARVLVAGATYTAEAIKAKAFSRPDTMRFEGSILRGTSPYANPDSVFLSVKIHQDGVSITDISGRERGRYSLDGGRILVLPKDSLVSIWVARAETPHGVWVDSARIEILYEQGFLNAYAPRLGYDTLTVEELRARVEFTEDSLIIVRRGAFYFGESPVYFNGSLRTDTSLTWKAEVSAPHGIYIPRLGLFFSGEVSGEGVGAERASLLLSLDTLSYNRYRVGQMVGPVEITHWKRFATPGITLTGPSVTGTISGWADMSGDVDLSFSLKALRLELLSDEMRGLAWGSGNLRRTKRKLAFGGDMWFRDCEWRDLALEEASLSIRAASDTMEGWIIARGISREDFVVDSLRLEGAIRGNIGGYTLFARTRDSWLSSEGFLSLSEEENVLEATRLEMNLKGLGAIKAGGFTLKWKEDELSFSLPKGEVFFGILSVGGWIKGDAITLALAVDSADMRALSASFGLKDTINGTLSLYTTVDGTLMKPRIGNITIIARGLEWTFLRVDTGYGEARLEGDTFTLDSLTLIAEGDTLWMNLAFRMRFSLIPFALRVDTGDAISGEIGVSGGVTPILGLFEKFVAFEETRARGRVQIYNTIGSPFLSGKVDFYAERGVVVPTGTALSKVEAQLSFQGDALSIYSMKAEAEGGRAEAQGSLWYKKGEVPMALSVDLIQFPIYPDPFMEAKVTGALSVEGTLRRPYVKGDLAVDEAFFYAPLGRKPAPRPPERPNPLKYEIRLRADRKAYFVNELIDLEFSAEMLLEKEPGALMTISGDVNVISGYLYFFDRTFEVTEGSLRMTKQSVIDPEMSIKAVNEIAPDTSVYLLLGGTLSKPDISLISDPPMPVGDIISLLTIGTTGAAPEYSAMGERAVNLAEGLLSRELRKKVRLQELEVRTGTFGGTPQFTIGWYLTRNLYVKYSTDLEKLESQYFQVKYFFKPKVAMYGEKDEAGVGVGFQYRIRF
ncbi:MAG: translocation/assembly module TamB domain-containing protein [candidate division WOR-3 bacterium]